MPSRGKRRIRISESELFTFTFINRDFEGTGNGSTGDKSFVMRQIVEDD
jgi:hypothetical protein